MTKTITIELPLAAASFLDEMTARYGGSRSNAVMELVHDAWAAFDRDNRSDVEYFDETDEYGADCKTIRVGWFRGVDAAKAVLAALVIPGKIDDMRIGMLKARAIRLIKEGHCGMYEQRIKDALTHPAADGQHTNWRLSVLSAVLDPNVLPEERCEDMADSIDMALRHFGPRPFGVNQNQSNWRDTANAH